MHADDLKCLLFIYFMCLKELKMNLFKLQLNQPKDRPKEIKVKKFCFFFCLLASLIKTLRIFREEEERKDKFS